MTKVISRFFDDATQAQAAKYEMLYRRRFSVRILDLYDAADGLAEKLTGTHVAADTAQAYQERMAASGGAVIVVRAGYKPLSVAQTARDVMREMGGGESAGLVEEVYVEDKINHTLSILEDHPHILTRPQDPNGTTFHMANWPIPLISRRKPFNDSIFPRHMRMAAFPIPLLYDIKPYTNSIFPRHARMANWPIPLLSDRKPYTGSIFAPHARMANFPLPLISRRKPYTGTAIGRHTRMANWPFPHLINGKTGTNALMPGGPRMANFPIRLLSKRKPFTGSIFPRHARMAAFPIPLLSRRKPYTGSAIAPHARMANFPWPLVISRSDTARKDGGTGYSFSKQLGLPTIIRR